MLNEIIAAGFENPEVGATNVLTLVSLYLAIVTGADAKVLVRTTSAARRATVRLLVLTGRKVEEVAETEIEAPAVSQAAKRLHRNASIHRY